MEDTLSIVVNNKDGQQEVMINLVNGKVMGGSIRKSPTSFAALVVRDKFDLCGYPYIVLGEDDEPEVNKVKV